MLQSKVTGWHFSGGRRDVGLAVSGIRCSHCAPDTQLPGLSTRKVLPVGNVVGWDSACKNTLERSSSFKPCFVRVGKHG